MSILNIFGARALKPRWSFSASHVLWRFLVSDDGLLLGEDRDTDNKTVSFFCIDMKTGDVLWREKQFGEAWWIGIEALVGERLYLHGFAQPDMPEHHGLIALATRTGAEAWQNADISFYAADNAQVIGYRDLFERRVFERFDASTGVFLGESDTAGAETSAMRKRAFGRTDFTFAQPLSVEDAEHGLIQSALAKHHAGDTAPLATEFARSGNRIFFSTHLPLAPQNGSQSPRLKNILCVVNADSGKEELFETLNAETPYPVPDSFFIDNETLYYIKEKQTLFAVPLR